MADEPLPLLRGKIERTESYRSPRGGGGDAIVLPPRDPGKHRAALVAQLDVLASDVKARAAGTRDEEATRELVAVVPEPALPKTALADTSLGDVSTDVVVVGRDLETGIVLLDAASAELAVLRRKIDAYADPTKTTDKNRPVNEPLVAPIHEVRRALLEDVADEEVRKLDPTTAHWVEVGCRGGIYERDQSARSKRELTRQLAKIDSQLGIAADFDTTSQAIFYVKATVTQLRALISAVDCVYEIHLAEPKMRDWLLLDHEQPDVGGHTLTAPHPNAPSVVLIDSGVLPTHPLLAPAVLSADSVVAGISSGVDIDGHGTQMAGVALHCDGVGDAATSGASSASHWLQAVKIITSASSSSDARERATWPPMTVAAIEIAEATKGPSNRVFAMAVTAAIDPVSPTTWSQAVDQLAYADGAGRVICVAAGNADSDDINLINGYPQLNLRQDIQDPAQAWNALTIGAFTARTKMPPDASYSSYAPIAPAGGISPHSSSRPLSADRVPNKPDIVFEGGNVAFDGALPDSTVATLTTLTTGHRPHRPLASIWATSEATARAGHLAASVWSADAKLRPATVRGLLVHAAAWTEQMKEQFESLEDRLRICGYGVPDPAFAMHCARDRATIVVEDAMPNGVLVERPKKKAPKRPTTPTTELVAQRIAKFFRLPIDENLLLEHDGDVELRVTLSYFAEIHTYRRRAQRGLDLRWEMQGPQENEDAFRWRINKLVRDGAAKENPKTKSFKWTIGPDRRADGTVQSDRWVGPASYLAGSKLIAIVPVGGWWNQYKKFETKELPFSLIVTVRAEGLDVYTPISTALRPVVSVEV